uniref:Nucleotide-binding protein CR976_00915 n=1 Tax=uncultured Thiotrichaceae bacterium TaxID=298394 RepID=A0A6S6RX85_9GAMM|nr:MAG: Nucleotide-binding protein CR976_00915 [uncultured Thiotrichaceae bacterium]
MQIVIISGMSGAGKSYALQSLEDSGYYCIDNLPSQLIESLLETPQILRLTHLAIGIDIRGGKKSIEEIPSTLKRIHTTYPGTRLIYLYANQHTLQRRYNETRRKHPLAAEEQELEKAIQLEKRLLEQLSMLADWRVDTSATSVYELGLLLKSRLVEKAPHEFSIMFQSFGFKHQTPYDSDFVFDVRNLPNPYWVPGLRKLTGQDEAITEWLEQHERVHELKAHIRDFLSVWMKDIQDNQRAYLTISIGCTGGRHRSVYMVEQLYQHFSQLYPQQVLIRHRELNYIHLQ